MQASKIMRVMTADRKKAEGHAFRFYVEISKRDCFLPSFS